MISIGTVFGGSEMAFSPIAKSIDLVASFFRNQKIGTDAGSLNIVFHVPGSLAKPDYIGARTAKFSKKKKLLMIQIAIPEKIVSSSNQISFLLDSIQQGVEIAKPVFERSRIEFPAEAYSALVEQAKGSLN